MCAVAREALTDGDEAVLDFGKSTSPSAGPQASSSFPTLKMRARFP